MLSSSIPCLSLSACQVDSDVSSGIQALWTLIKKSQGAQSLALGLDVPVALFFSSDKISCLLSSVDSEDVFHVTVAWVQNMETPFLWMVVPEHVCINRLHNNGNF